jgi:hypothetical protein
MNGRTAITGYPVNLVVAGDAAWSSAPAHRGAQDRALLDAGADVHVDRARSDPDVAAGPMPGGSTLSSGPSSRRPRRRVARPRPPPATRPSTAPCSTPARTRHVW